MDNCLLQRTEIIPLFEENPDVHTYVEEEEDAPDE
ncbi:hypothetical protein NUACC26_046050 [Scytonema sp. NUACC26]